MVVAADVCAIGDGAVDLLERAGHMLRPALAFVRCEARLGDEEREVGPAVGGGHEEVVEAGLPEGVAHLGHPVGVVFGADAGAEVDGRVAGGECELPDGLGAGGDAAAEVIL